MTKNSTASLLSQQVATRKPIIWILLAAIGLVMTAQHLYRAGQTSHEARTNNLEITARELGRRSLTAEIVPTLSSSAIDNLREKRLEPTKRETYQIGFVNEKIEEVEKKLAGLSFDSSSDKRQPCRMAIENKMDKRYDNLQSIALRFPIPWSELNCSLTNAPIIVDFFLVRWDVPSTSPLHEWEAYFHDKLEGREFIRSDGIPILFGNATKIFSGDYEEKYPVKIGARCEDYNYGKWMRSGRGRFCVLYNECTSRECIGQQSYSCWLSPAKGKDKCYFLPADLPPFAARPMVIPSSHKISMCALMDGAVSDFEQLGVAMGLFRKQASSPRIELRFVGSISSEEQQNLVTIMSQEGFVDYEFIRASGLLGLNEEISQNCDTILSMQKSEVGAKLGYASGIPQIVAYRIPSILHDELHSLYAPLLTASSLSFNSTTTLVQAVEKMVNILQQRQTAAE